MVNRTQVALNDAAEWLGDWHPLAEQLGSADGLVSLASASSLLRLQPVSDLPSLRRLLREYQGQVLVPLELPAILSAFGFASQNGARELVALDRRLAVEPLLRSFADPSRRVGQSQLRKLRPLRDVRMVQRYWQAVEAGQAHGWHTLVYGLTLAIYSLPPRQGLLGYGHQTTRGFVYAAARGLRLSERACRRVFDEACDGLPGAVESLVRQDDGRLSGAWRPTISL
jgi:urease accessory protein UreF